MNSIKAFIKKETVFFVSLTAALISCFFILPDKEYIGYIDFRVIALLFCLMTVTAGMKECKVLDSASALLMRRCGNTKTAALILILLCFFSSMLITNDVALITFVPITAAVLGAAGEETLIKTICFETVAANLGSSATPIGNPQNLYLYSFYNMKIGDFLSAVLPVAGVGAVLVIILSLCIKKENMPKQNCNKIEIEKKKAVLFFALFLLCILCVLRIVDYRICFIVCFCAVLIFSIKTLKRVDYMLLLTFVCFFVFVGNIGRIDEIKKVLGMLISGRELLASVLLSQAVSNVPAAVMLSGFTQNGRALLIGTNIGGLGTLVASLASLISYKIYCKREGARRLKYFSFFTIVNFALLAVLLLFAYLFL